MAENFFDLDAGGVDFVFKPNFQGALLFNQDGTSTAHTAKILAGTLTDYFVECEELLGDVFFLCDDKAASAGTGIVLPIDAGFAAYSGVWRII